jgi:6-pyruvoyltetrahydropterin/6-carboxytetrahydropterin synthase
MIHRATKTYGDDLGLSVAFRQWRADSHCRYLHGYAIGVRLTFEAS